MTDPSSANLLSLAHQLRDAAVRAGRTDVAAKAAEAIACLGPQPDGAEPERKGEDSGNTVVRFLDGLGL